MGSTRTGLLATVTLIASLGGAAQAASLTPTAHGYTRSFGTGQAFGDALAIQVFQSYPYQDRGVVEFDLTGLSGPVLSAELWFPLITNTTANGAAALDVTVRGYAGNGTIDYSDHTAGSDVASFDAKGLSEITLDVTSAIAARIGNGDTYAGFTTRFDAEGNYAVVPYASWLQLWAQGSNPLPELRIELGQGPGAQVPLPAPAVLLVTALGGLAATRRKKG